MHIPAVIEQCWIIRDRTVMQIYWFFFLMALVKADVKQSQCPPTASSIQHLLDKAFMYGAAIVVVNRSDTVYQQAFGYDNPLESSQRQLINVSNSVFLLASISKTFIPVAAMQMVEANRLNLDTDINQYLSPILNVVHPQYPNVTITMRHLLMHASGIGINPPVEIESYTLGDAFTQITLGDVLTKYFNGTAGWLPIPPGNRTFYSNSGTNLAAFIIERLAGMRFEQYVQDRILKPLGITEKMGGYRLSNFDEKFLVGNYLYNESISAELNVYLQRLNVTAVSIEVVPRRAVLSPIVHRILLKIIFLRLEIRHGCVFLFTVQVYMLLVIYAYRLVD